jgi:HK97 family phage major capsid protein
MLNEIFRLATEQGGILSHVRRLNIPANVAVPIATPSAMAQWHNEGDEVDPDKIDVKNVTFAGYELMKVFSISAAARAMSLSAFESYLQQELNRTIVTALQYAAVNGTGNGQPLGLMAEGVIENVIEGGTNIYQGFAKALGSLKQGYSMGAVWALNNTTLYEKVTSFTDGNGRPLFNEPREGATGRILGKSVVVDDFLPDNVVLLGNFQFYAMNYPQSIMLEVSRDSSFRRGLIDYRAMCVADGKPVINEAFIKLELP